MGRGARGYGRGARGGRTGVNSTPVQTEEEERESEEEEEEEMETERVHAGRENNKRRIEGDEGGPPQKR
jgi:hypothetical protein